MAVPFSSPKEIDQLVASGNMDPTQAERAKAQFFPGYIPPVAPEAPMASPVAPPIGSSVAAFNPKTDQPMEPSANMAGAVPVSPMNVSTVNHAPLMGTTTKSETQATRMVPGSIQGAQEASQAYADSAKNLMEATAAHNNSLAEGKAALATRQFDDVEKETARRDLEQKDLESRRNDIRSEIDKLADQKVNSGRFYQNMGTGDKVLAAISVALGGFASAMQGKPGENAALSIIDRAVQRDIDEQIKNLDNSRQITALKDQDLSRLIQLTGSKQAARDALMAKQYQAIASKLDAQASMSGPNDPVIAARAKELADQLRLSIAQKQMDVEKNVTQTTSVTAPLKGPVAESPGQKTLDAAFAKDYNDWSNGGAKAAKIELNKLKGVAADLKSGKSSTGMGTGMLPDRFTSNQTLKTRADVESSITSSLRHILGAQFTQKEGERIIKNTWNESDSPANNLTRVNRLVDTLQAQAKDKDAKSKYFERNGTLSGYQMPTAPREK